MDWVRVAVAILVVAVSGCMAGPGGGTDGETPALTESTETPTETPDEPTRTQTLERVTETGTDCGPNLRLMRAPDADVNASDSEVVQYEDLPEDARRLVDRGIPEGIYRLDSFGVWGEYRYLRYENTTYAITFVIC